MCWPDGISSHKKSNIAAPFLPFWKSKWIYGCSCVCSKAGTTTPTAVGQLRGRKAWCNLWYVIYYHFAAPWKMNFSKFWADGKGEHWESPGISKSIVLCWQKDTVTTHFSCQLAAVTQSIMVGCWITSQWNSAWLVILVLHGLWDKRGMNRPPGKGSTPGALIKVPIKKSNGTGNGKLASSACYRAQPEQLSRAKGNISLLNRSQTSRNASSLRVWGGTSAEALLGVLLVVETCWLLLPVQCGQWEEVLLNAAQKGCRWLFCGICRHCAVLVLSISWSVAWFLLQIAHISAFLYERQKPAFSPEQSSYQRDCSCVPGVKVGSCAVCGLFQTSTGAHSREILQ